MFEFQILHASSLVSQEELNKIGKERWSLVTIINDPAGDGYYYIFQRLIYPTVDVRNIKLKPLPMEPGQTIQTYTADNG